MASRRLEEDLSMVPAVAADLGLLVPGRIRLPAQGFSLPDLEREIILKALDRCAGNRSATARYLGIPRHVLLYRLKKYERESAPA